MNRNNIIGNGSTVIKTIATIFAGWCVGYFASKGFNLPISETELAELFFSLIGLLLAYIDASFPNSFGFLDNAEPIVNVENEADLINPDYYEEEET